MPLTEEDIKLMERFLVPRRELDDILERHGEKISDNILSRIEPRLVRMEDCLHRGTEQFEDHEGRIRTLEDLDPITEINRKGEAACREIYWTKRKIIMWIGLVAAAMAALGGIATAASHLIT